MMPRAYMSHEAVGSRRVFTDRKPSPARYMWYRTDELPRLAQRSDAPRAHVRMHPTSIALTVHASCVRWRTASRGMSTYALPARTHEQAEGWRLGKPSCKPA